MSQTIEDLNEDDPSPDPAAATAGVGVGDRLVQASFGLGEQPGRWVHALAAREGPGGTRSEQTARWLAEPARDRVWSRLTGGAIYSTGSRAWPGVLLSRVLWLTVAATGAGLL